MLKNYSFVSKTFESSSFGLTQGNLTPYVKQSFVISVSDSRWCKIWREDKMSKLRN